MVLDQRFQPRRTTTLSELHSACAGELRLPGSSNVLSRAHNGVPTRLYGPIFGYYRAGKGFLEHPIPVYEFDGLIWPRRDTPKVAPNQTVVVNYM
jgi:hypothetical protein